MDYEEELVMLWLYTDFIDYNGNIRISDDYLGSLYDEIRDHNSDEGRIAILERMISIINR